MGFIRSFDISKIDKMSAASAELFARLKADMRAQLPAECVFPTVRKGVIDFYYKGGCLYRFNGLSFKRNLDYEKDIYNNDTAGLDRYERAKKQNKNKFTNTDGSMRERQLLDKLNSHTFNGKYATRAVVLDIEVRLNGTVGGNKKCDMVLLNREARQIMFVEGKVFSDKRVNTEVGFMPEVIEQVSLYTEGLDEQAKAIIEQYAQHIQIINALFGTEYKAYGLTLVPKAKLLVYDTPLKPTVNGKHSIDTINKALVTDNIFWVASGKEPTIDEIWDALCK